jgi:hypothetical protein
MDRLIQLIPAAIGGGGLPTAFYALDVSGVIWYGTARAGRGPWSSSGFRSRAWKPRSRTS